eukprot:9132-Pyramimonas_sp.AAC.1
MKSPVRAGAPRAAAGAACGRPAAQARSGLRGRRRCRHRRRRRRGGEGLVPRTYPYWIHGCYNFGVDRLLGVLAMALLDIDTIFRLITCKACLLLGGAQGACARRRAAAQSGAASGGVRAAQPEDRRAPRRGRPQGKGLPSTPSVSP